MSPLDIQEKCSFCCQVNDIYIFRIPLNKLAKCYGLVILPYLSYMKAADNAYTM